jgi:opacity protein-like surface antigen
MTPVSLKPSAWLASAALVGVLSATLGALQASAQTVVMRALKPGDTLEATLRDATATGKVGADGIATATLNAIDASPKAELVVNVHVDNCGTTWRVVLVERSLESPSPGPGCARRDVPGAFVIRRVTSLAIDASGATPSLLIRQGPPPSSWFAGPSTAQPRDRFIPPAGLMVHGAGGVGKISDAVALFCGDATQCSGKSSQAALKAGVAFWLTPYVGAFGNYVKLTDVTATGSGNRFRFDSLLDAEVLSVAGGAGAPVGRVRLYGFVGLNYHRALFSTGQTTDPVTVTVNDQPFILEGGTQRFEFETSGWGWVFGGGAEIWAMGPLAIYTEFEWSKLKGDDRNGGEPTINDKMTLFVVGVRYRLGLGGR